METRPHIIRLRDPWQWIAHDSPASGFASIRAKRWFHRPTGLCASTRVALVIEGIPALHAVHFNGQLLQGRQQGAIWTSELDPQMPARNQLELHIESREPATLPDNTLPDNLRTLLTTGNVRLEIRT